MTVREDADYAIEIAVGLDTVEPGLLQARRFVRRMHEHLAKSGFEDE